MQVVFLGDIVGNQALERASQFIIEEKAKNPNSLLFANVENTSNGFGITEEHHNKLVRAGFDLLSGGNHIWDKREIFTYISRSKIARPYNLPKGTPGKGWQIVEKNNQKVGLINLLGRVFMSVSALDCPFRSCDKAIEELQAQKVSHIIVDIHAEANSEKMSLAHYLDGRVSAVLGSHTHVQTSDEVILPNGTAYITDMGACCAINSVLGMTKESALHKFLTGLPGKFDVANNPIKVSGVRISFEDNNLKASSIERISVI